MSFYLKMKELGYEGTRGDSNNAQYTSVLVWLSCRLVRSICVTFFVDLMVMGHLLKC